MVLIREDRPRETTRKYGRRDLQVSRSTRRTRTARAGTDTNNSFGRILADVLGSNPRQRVEPAGRSHGGAGVARVRRSTRKWVGSQEGAGLGILIPEGAEYKEVQRDEGEGVRYTSEDAHFESDAVMAERLQMDELMDATSAYDQAPPDGHEGPDDPDHPEDDSEDRTTGLQYRGSQPR